MKYIRTTKIFPLCFQKVNERFILNIFYYYPYEIYRRDRQGII